MPAAVPIWPSVSFNPDSGDTSTAEMLLTMVTSSPSRIQVIPRARTTSQCHLAHGSLSILDGIRLSTALPAALASLTFCLLSIGRKVRPLQRIFLFPAFAPGDTSLTPLGLWSVAGRFET